LQDCALKAAEVAFRVKKLKIRRGDTVRIVAGKDRTARNAEGRVVRVIPEKNLVVVEGLNIAKKASETFWKRIAGWQDRQGNACSHLQCDAGL